MTYDQAQRITDSIHGLIFANIHLREACDDPSADPEWFLQLGDDLYHARTELTQRLQWLEAPEWAL
jgi:hypothetical protein